MFKRPSQTTITLLAWLAVLSSAACTVYKSSDRDFFDSNGFAGGPTPKVSPTATPSAIDSISPLSTDCHVVHQAGRQPSLSDGSSAFKVEHDSLANKSSVQVLRQVDLESAALCTVMFTYAPSSAVTLIEQSRVIEDQFVRSLNE